ncbi:hypothetical protein LCGC14_1220690 [marine sediment metagenome]|uniref:Helix-turn-helix domain-containing protein n=1 Tax=marine sediment metagenome TaxID=412755 RepID=A0A0F9LFC2_9ZZZZ
MTTQPFVLRTEFGPPDIPINCLYDETPEQRNHLVEVKYQHSAERLMFEGYELVEDPEGVIDPTKARLNPEQVSELTGYARSTIYKYIDNGKLLAEKLDTPDGPRYRISRIDAEALRIQRAGAAG